jgi:rhodanese-related sulfurtransferase
VLLSSLIAGATNAREQQLPTSKRTSLGLYVTAKHAYEKWKADPTNIKIIDVRTPDEFRLIGLPKMAAKIPLTASAGEFVGRVKRIAEPNDTLFVICRSGNRSATAIEMLARSGFKNAYTVVDGFEGDRNTDPSSPGYGKRTVNGWKNAGLPWKYDGEAERTPPSKSSAVR